MLLMIDNYDSFTYNVVQYLGELGADVEVVRNDQVTVGEIATLAPEKIVISPGPCTRSALETTVRRLPRSRGLEMKSNAPSFRACTAVSTLPCAVMTATGRPAALV